MVSKLKRESINQANKLYWPYHFIKNTLPVNRSLLVVSRVISQSKAKSARFTGTLDAPFPLAAFFSSLAYSGCYQSRVIPSFASADGFSRVLFGISWYCTLWTFLWQQFLLIKNFYKSKTFTLDIIAQMWDHGYLFRISEAANLNVSGPWKALFIIREGNWSRSADETCSPAFQKPNTHARFLKKNVVPTI